MAALQKITTHLWFDRNAEEAVSFYVSVFKKASIGKITFYGREGNEIHGMQAGSIMTIEFKLEGQNFVALNGGPHFKFNEAVSLMITCKTQNEIDYYWDTLGKGGDEKAQICGWLKDRFGLSWQVVPAGLAKMLQSKNEKRKGRVVAALLKMKKLDLAQLEAAYRL